MREAAEPAEALRGFLEIDAGEGIGVGAVRRDAEAIEKGLADQMRRPALHVADADVDARLAEIDRAELRMRIGDVQDARVAEALDFVDARVVDCGAREARPRARQRGGRRHLQKIPAADAHCSVSAPSQRFNGFPCPSSVPSRWSPGRSRPWRAPRLPSRTPRPGRSRPRLPLFLPPPKLLPSWSIDCATGLPLSRRPRPWQTPP